MNYPCSSGTILPTARVVPSDVGMMLWTAAWPSYHSSPEDRKGVRSGHTPLHEAKVLWTLAAGWGKHAGNLGAAVILLMATPSQTQGHQHKVPMTL